MPAARIRKPTAAFDDLRQCGFKTYELATRHRAKVEPRLGAGVLDGLAKDLALLNSLVSETEVTGTQTKAATANQNERLADAAATVSAIRIGVAKQGATAEQRAGYGLPTKLNAKVVTSVIALGNVIIARARKRPAEARSFGILGEDLEDLRTLLAALEAADAAQEKARAWKPTTTRERDEAAQRIAKAVRAISGAGVIAFRTDPVLRAAFDALDDGLSRSRTKKPAV